MNIDKWRVTKVSLTAFLVTLPLWIQLGLGLSA